MPNIPDIKITNIHVDRTEALRYLHHKGQALPPEITAALDAAADTVCRQAAPRFVYKLFPLQWQPGPQLAGTNLTLPGRAVTELLADCGQCLLLAATLGTALDDTIRRTQITDIGRALLLDACASTAIEDICDRIEQQLTNALQAQGYHLTRRFSPGYGDLPLDTQKPLCTALDAARRIGLTVSASNILLPRKSVTAIIGLSTQPQPQTADPCAICPLAAGCIFRQNGKLCGKHQPT